MARLIPFIIVGIPRNVSRAANALKSESCSAASASEMAGPSSAAASAQCSNNMMSTSTRSNPRDYRVLYCLQDHDATSQFIHESELHRALGSHVLRSGRGQGGPQVRQWALPFLFGSGITALGFAAYTSHGHDRVMQLPSISASAEGLPPAVGSPSNSAPSSPLSSTSICSAADGGGDRWQWPPWRWWWRSFADCRDLTPATDVPCSSQPSMPGVGMFPVPQLSGSTLAGCSSGSSTPTSVPSGSSSSSSWSAWSPSSSAGPPPIRPLTRASISDAAARASPAVVHLAVVRQGQFGATHTPWPSGNSGSGFIYDGGGYILTNAHVVAEAEGSGHLLAVTLQDGRVFQGSVVKSDRASDLAIVKIDSPKSLPVASLGRSAQLLVGEWVVALGSPLTLKQSVTAGIVSCVERKGSEMGLAWPLAGYIQTDCAINMGNSGGPLVNLDGDVVGILSLSALAANGVSFAIPIDAAQEVVRQLSVHGRVIRPYVGCSLGEVRLAQTKLAQVPGLPATDKMYIVQRVAAGSPAAQAGLMPEDIIVAVAGEEASTMGQIVERFTTSIGRPCELRILRKVGPNAYNALTMTLTPVEAP